MAQPEHALQCAVAGFLNHALPIGSFWTSIDHATKSASEGEKKKRRGVKRGVPDVLIVVPNRTIWIELKAPKGRVSEAQLQVKDSLELNGHHYYVAKSVAEVEGILRDISVPLRATTGLTAQERDAGLLDRASKPAFMGVQRIRKPSQSQITRNNKMTAFRLGIGE